MASNFQLLEASPDFKVAIMEYNLKRYENIDFLNINHNGPAITWRRLNRKLSKGSSGSVEISTTENYLTVIDVFESNVDYFRKSCYG